MNVAKQTACSAAVEDSSIMVLDAMVDAGFNHDSELDLFDLWTFLAVFRWR